MITSIELRNICEKMCLGYEDDVKLNLSVPNSTYIHKLKSQVMSECYENKEITGISSINFNQRKFVLNWDGGDIVVTPHHVSLYEDGIIQSRLSEDFDSNYEENQDDDYLDDCDVNRGRYDRNNCDTIIENGYMFAIHRVTGEVMGWS